MNLNPNRKKYEFLFIYLKKTTKIAHIIKQFPNVVYGNKFQFSFHDFFISFTLTKISQKQNNFQTFFWMRLWKRIK